MVSRAAIRATVTSFWSSVGGRHSFGLPIDLERAVVRVLPLAVHRISSLSTDTVSKFLRRLPVEGFDVGAARDLRGCLIADVGVGFVLIEADDPDDEQRLTLAHEVAHFLLHYLIPRNRAIAALGSKIIPTLDRTRAATGSELFSSALRAVPIAPYRHAMLRKISGPLRGLDVMEAEADEMALEFLAPHDLVNRAESDPAEIALRFGIPLDAAARVVSNADGVVTTIGVQGLFGIR